MTEVESFFAIYVEDRGREGAYRGHGKTFKRRLAADCVCVCVCVHLFLITATKSSLELCSYRHLRAS